MMTIVNKAAMREVTVRVFVSRLMSVIAFCSVISCKHEKILRMPSAELNAGHVRSPPLHL
jgi:hypothetical protein